MMHWWPWADRSGQTPAGQTRFVVFDLEMSGLDPARGDILSVGALRMTGGRMDLSGLYSSLVRPAGQRLEAQNVRVHQLTPGQLAAHPPIQEVLPAFLEFIGDAVLTGWHVELDMAFLRSWARRLGLGAVRNKSLDVLGLYLAIRGGRASQILEELPLKDVDLYNVARALGVAPRGAHDALGDAYVTAQVFQRFLSMLRASRQGEDPTLATLLKVSAPSSRARAAPQAGF